MGDITIHIQETKQNSNRINLKKSMPRHIEINLVQTEDKEKFLKAAREKHPYPVGEQFEHERLLTRNHGGSKEEAQHFQV